MLRGEFAEEAKKLKAAKQRVREMCGGRRRGGGGGASLKEKEHNLGTRPLPTPKRHRG